MIFSGHSRLKKISVSIHNQVSRFSYKSLQKKSHLQSSVQYHRQIINAMKARDKTLACRLTKEHVIAALDVLLSMPDRKDANVKESSLASSVRPLSGYI
jgi:DNA-binding GntR family transcriptional regulator